MTHSRLLRGLTPLASLALVGACLVAACSSGSDSHGAAIPSGGSSSSDAGAGGSRRDPIGTSGGSGGSSTEGGEAGDGVNGGASGAAGSQEGTVVVVTPAACSQTPSWTGAAPLDVISTAADERLLSITADELDVAFLRGGALYVAHRDAASASFAAPTAVTLPADYVADAGIALSADGKTLVLVATSGMSFAALTRDDRTADFSATADDSAFVALNDRAAQTQEHYAAPVLAPDGKSFVFSGFTPGYGDVVGVSFVYESLLSGEVWDMPGNLSHESFDGTDTKRPLPTALSSDSRTLFYFDEATSTEMVRFRDRPDAPLGSPIDISGLDGAVPNTKCDRVYYSSAGDVLTEVYGAP